MNCGIIGGIKSFNDNDKKQFLKILNYLIGKNYTFYIDDNSLLDLDLDKSKFNNLSGSNFKILNIIIFLNGDIHLLNKIFNILILNLEMKLYLFNYKYWKSLEAWFEYNNIDFIKSNYSVIENFASFKNDFDTFNSYENKLNNLLTIEPDQNNED